MGQMWYTLTQDREVDFYTKNDFLKIQPPVSICLWGYGRCLCSMPLNFCFSYNEFGLLLV